MQCSVLKQFHAKIYNILLLRHNFIKYNDNKRYSIMTGSET